MTLSALVAADTISYIEPFTNAHIWFVAFGISSYWLSCMLTFSDAHAKAFRRIKTP